MSFSTDYNDDKVFDRLVDGELSPAERQSLLATLDEREDGWRRCATAFLEAQAWQQQFKRITREPAAIEPTLNIERQSGNAGTTAGRWLALAAGLMLAFTVGWLSHSPEAAPTLNRQIAENHSQDSQFDGELQAAGESDADAVTLFVRDVNGKNQRLRVPLVEGENWDEQLGFASAELPHELRAEFQDHGLDVQRRRRYAPMFFEQNEQLVPMVVPVEDTYVAPVNLPVY